MINIDFPSKDDIINAFPDEISCLRHLEYLRWKDIVISPFDSFSTVYTCSNNRFRCKNTGKYFNAKTGTLFYNSKIPLQKWFLAIWVISRRKRGITSVELAEEIAITQKSAWYMLQRINSQLQLSNPKPGRKNAPKKSKSPADITVIIDKDKMNMLDWLEKMKK